MKVIILRSTVAGGKPVEADDVIDASKEDAATLISLKKAEEANEKNLKALAERKKAAKAAE